MEPKSPYVVECICVCGKVKNYYLSNILPKPNARYTHSCGCIRGKLVADKNSTHRLSGTKFYRHWRSMLERTENENYINSDSYKGIRVSKRWHEFLNFKEDMYESWLIHNREHGGRDTTIDRIDVYGNYNKENCRWATQAEQGLNKKNTVRVIYEGKEISLKQLCEDLGKNYKRVYPRIRSGFSLNRALHAEPWQRI